MSDDPTQQKKWGLARLISLIATALLFFSFFLPWFGWSSWSCSGSDCQPVTLSVKTNPPVSSGFSVASNGLSLVSASATVGDRTVIAASIDNFSTSSWLLLVAIIAPFLSQILINLFKTVARWEQPFTLIITAVALYVEILYMVSTFGVIKQVGSIKSVLFSRTPCNDISGSGSLSLYATLTTSKSLVDATLHLSHGPSFGFWLGLLATLVVGGVGVVRVVEAYRASSRGLHLRHD